MNEQRKAELIILYPLDVARHNILFVRAVMKMKLGGTRTERSDSHFSLCLTLKINKFGFRRSSSEDVQKHPPPKAQS